MNKKQESSGNQEYPEWFNPKLATEWEKAKIRKKYGGGESSSTLETAEDSIREGGQEEKANFEGGGEPPKPDAWLGKYYYKQMTDSEPRKTATIIKPDTDLFEDTEPLYSGQTVRKQFDKILEELTKWQKDEENSARNIELQNCIRLVEKRREVFDPE